MKIWKVEWFDACSWDDWEEMDVAMEYRPPLMISVGFLLRDDPTRVIIAMTWDKAGEKVSQVLAIPRAWIKEMKEMP